MEKYSLLFSPLPPKLAHNSVDIFLRQHPGALTPAVIFTVDGTAPSGLKNIRELLPRMKVSLCKFGILTYLYLL